MDEKISLEEITAICSKLMHYEFFLRGIKKKKNDVHITFHDAKYQSSKSLLRSELNDENLIKIKKEIAEAFKKKKKK